MKPIRAIFVAFASIFASIPLVHGQNHEAAEQAGDAKPRQIRVIVFNVQLLPGVAAFANFRPHPEYRAKRIAAELADYDIIVLNEAFDRRHRRILLEELKRRFGGECHLIQPPAKSVSKWGIGSGLVIVSRFPAVSQHFASYDNDSAPEKYGLAADGFARKGVLHARLQLGKLTSSGQPFEVDVFGTHLESHSRSIRIAQYGKLAAFIKQFGDPNRPALLLGDLNTDGSSANRRRPDSAYRQLTTELSKASAEMKDAWTVLHPHDLGATNNGGTRRIDYLFLANPTQGRRLQLSSIRVNRFPDKKTETLSDHAAVEAKLRPIIPNVPGANR